MLQVMVRLLIYQYLALFLGIKRQFLDHISQCLWRLSFKIEGRQLEYCYPSKNVCIYMVCSELPARDAGSMALIHLLRVLQHTINEQGHRLASWHAIVPNTYFSHTILAGNMHSTCHRIPQHMQSYLLMQQLADKYFLTKDFLPYVKMLFDQCVRFAYLTWRHTPIFFIQLGILAINVHYAPPKFLWHPRNPTFTGYISSPFILYTLASFILFLGGTSQAWKLMFL